jgi:hypothetical protein
MSDFMPDTKPQERESTKGPEAYLSPDERKALQRSLSFPEDLPPKFKSWLIDFLAVNVPQIPISQIVGFDKLLYKRGTVFPTDPRDGQMFGYQVDANTIWQFRYDSGITDAYKWIFTGGPPLTHSVAGTVSTSSATYVDLTGGPTLTAARAGKYLLDSTSEIGIGAGTGWAAPHYGSTPVDDESVTVNNVPSVTCSRSVIATITSAAQTVKMQYRASGGTSFFARRTITLLPIRVI